MSNEASEREKLIDLIPAVPKEKETALTFRPNREVTMRFNFCKEMLNKK